MHFWNNSKKTVSLVCDVGSASITLALVDFSQVKPLIHFSIRIPIAVQPNYDLNLLEKSVLIYVDEALRNLESNRKSGGLFDIANLDIDIAHIIFSSPWYASKIVLDKQANERPITLDHKFFDQILDSKERTFENEIISSPKTRILGSIHAIERELLQVKLNGYVTNDPLMKKATDISSSILISVVSHDLFIKISNKIKDQLHINHIFAHSFPFVAWSALSLISKHEDTYVMLDIAGEMTDIVTVKDGVIEKIYSIELGRNALIRALAVKLDCPIEVAISNLSLYSADKLDEQMKKRVDEALSAYMTIWRFKIEEGGGARLFAVNDSRKFFATIDDDVALPFISTLKNSIGDEKVVFQITSSIIGDILGYNKHVARDPFIAIEAIFIKKLYKELLQ